MQHAKRDTGESAAPPPVHHVVAKTAYTPSARVQRISSFQFLDEGDWVKVYLPLDGLADLPADAVTADVGERALTATVRGLPDGAMHVFTVAALQHAVVVEECSCRVLKSRVVVKLKKAVVGTSTPTWTKLRA